MRHLHLLLLALATLAACSPRRHGPAATAERLDSLFAWRYGSNSSQAPGCAVLISRPDSTIYEHYQGVADLCTQEPIDSATRFCIASVSKQFTVAALLQQAALGRVSLADTVARFYPEYTRPFWNTITLADLAGHTSGLPDARDRSDRDACVHATDSSSILFFADVDSLRFAPGTAYDYQNPTFLLLAGVVEKCSGTDFISYAAANLFGKAGMRSTYYFSPDSAPAHQAHAYAPDDLGARWHEFDYGEETFFATRPDGGIYSTARDMARWQHALAKGRIVPDSLLARARTPRIDVASSPWCDYQQRPHTWYGLGWFVDTTPGAPLKSYHTGDNGGFQAYVAYYPADSLSVVVLENRHDRDRWSMACEIEQILVESGLLHP